MTRRVRLHCIDCGGVLRPVTELWWRCSGLKCNARIEFVTTIPPEPRRPRHLNPDYDGDDATSKRFSLLEVDL